MAAEVEKIFVAPPTPHSKGVLATNLYTETERLTLSYRVTWACSEMVNLYNRQIVVLPRKTKTYATVWPKAPFRTNGPR
jgi:hypothetical protein